VLKHRGCAFPPLRVSKHRECDSTVARVKAPVCAFHRCACQSTGVCFLPLRVSKHRCVLSTAARVKAPLCAFHRCARVKVPECDFHRCACQSTAVCFPPLRVSKHRCVLSTAARVKAPVCDFHLCAYLKHMVCFYCCVFKHKSKTIGITHSNLDLRLRRKSRRLGSVTPILTCACFTNRHGEPVLHSLIFFCLIPSRAYVKKKKKQNVTPANRVLETKRFPSLRAFKPGARFQTPGKIPLLRVFKHSGVVFLLHVFKHRYNFDRWFFYHRKHGLIQIHVRCCTFQTQDCEWTPPRQ